MVLLATLMTVLKKSHPSLPRDGEHGIDEGGNTLRRKTKASITLYTA